MEHPAFEDVFQCHVSFQGCMQRLFVFILIDLIGFIMSKFWWIVSFSDVKFPDWFEHSRWHESWESEGTQCHPPQKIRNKGGYVLNESVPFCGEKIGPQKDSTRWWQLKYLFIFTRILVEMIQFDLRIYVSQGLVQPPTRDYPTQLYKGLW